MHDRLAESAPLLLGLALGMRHAFDPDHMLAMSTIVTRERSIRAPRRRRAFAVGLVHGLAGSGALSGSGISINTLDLWDTW